MPNIDVSVVAGRDHDTLKKLAQQIHDTTVAALHVPAESVRVLIREVPAELWSSGGTTIADRRETAS